VILPTDDKRDTFLSDADLTKQMLANAGYEKLPGLCAAVAPMRKLLKLFSKELSQ
jgi:hypothetical protein